MFGRMAPAYDKVDLWNQKAWEGIQVLPLSNSIALGKLLNLPELSCKSKINYFLWGKFVGSFKEDDALHAENSAWCAGRCTEELVLVEVII